MTTPEQYAALQARYKSVEDIDAEFGMELDMAGDPLILDFEAGGVSPEIRKADKERRLLTMIDGDNGETLFVVGFARVNRIAHYATEKPMPEELYTSRLCVEA